MRAFNDIVVVDAASPLGITALEALSASQILSHFSGRVLAATLLNNHEVGASVLDCLKKINAKGVEASVRTADNPIPINNKALVIYFCDEFIPTHLQASIVGITPLESTLIVVTSGESSSALSSALGSMKEWAVMHVKIGAWGPPTFLGGKARISVLTGPIENLCLGVALGVTKLLRVNASTEATVVPCEVALNTSVIALREFSAKKIDGIGDRPNHFVMDMRRKEGSGLVWGMIGEYILDYYGRYHEKISKAIPSRVFARDPSLAFNVQLQDIWNYGIDLFLPVEMYRDTRAKGVRNHLEKFPHSSTSERMKGALVKMDATIEYFAKGTTQKTTVDENESNLYLLLLRLLAQQRKFDDYFSVSLDSIHWESYVKNIAVAVLRYVCAVFFSCPEADFPKPTLSFVNDLIFVATERAPPPNYRLRRWFEDLHCALRSGQQPDGHPRKLSPGGTPKRQFAILAQPHIQLLISQLAKDQNLDRQAVEKRAASILRGIGDTMNHRHARSMAYLMRKIFRTLYDRLIVNDEAFDRLFKAFHRPRTAVVLIPSHRSYIDFMIVSFMFFVMGLPFPHVCAGEDFLRLGALSDALRGCGAFFMRRSFKGDKLYGSLFKEYVRHLCRDCQAIEFFIEGMRSRTGKTLPPRVGILKMITDSFLENQEEVDDILFFPISLSYEKVLEGSVYADELLGIPKPKETMGNLLKSATVLREKHGSLNVVVGEHISLVDFIKNPCVCPHESLVPKPSEDLEKKPTGMITSPYLLNRLAWKITNDLEKNIVITPSALLCGAVLHLHDEAELKKWYTPCFGCEFSGMAACNCSS